MHTTEEINELKSLVKRINYKLGFEGIGFRLDGGGNFERLNRAISLLKVVADSIDA
jgi:hypothetical protein